MSEKPDLTDGLVNSETGQSEIHVNDYGDTTDPAVVVQEKGRTVLLTEDETIVFEKQPHIEIAPANRPRKVYAGMWGTAEIAAVGVASLAVLGTMLLYFFAVVPSNRDVEKNRADGDRLQSELTSARSKFGGITNTRTRVAELVSSVTDFELNNLPVALVGKNALYQRINGLIAAYGLVNTTGPDYVPLETADQNSGQQTEEERGRARFRSLFPGVYVTMTLDGPYQNLRRFINDIEQGNDFVVISSIELEPSDGESHKTDTAATNQLASAQTGGPNAPGFGGVVNPQTGRQPIQPQQPSVQRGKMHGETVSLRLELAAYFRRPNFVPMEAVPEQRATKGGVQ